MSACSACAAPLLPGSRFCEACGLRVSGPEDHREQTSCCGAGVTDRGRRRLSNEDAFAFGCASTLSWGVVCDGVSAVPNSAQAARAAADTAAKVLADLAPAGQPAAEAVRLATAAAARAVAALGGAGEPPSCTFVCGVVGNGTVTVGWLGDSRAYWLDGAGSVQLSEDDALDGSHAITRWLGADADDTEPRVVVFEPSGAGTLLLCSDGLWNYTPSAAGLAAAAPDSATEPLAAARRLIDISLAAGGHDNITALLMPTPTSHGKHRS